MIILPGYEQWTGIPWTVSCYYANVAVRDSAVMRVRGCRSQLATYIQLMLEREWRGSKSGDTFKRRCAFMVVDISVTII